MRRVFLTLLIYIGIYGLVNAQESDNQLSGPSVLEQIDRENVFIHYNTSLLLAGEYFYYRVYLLNKAKNELSNLSKIAYTTLIAENGNTVFEHKIILDKGLGQGDFFIPVTVPSGNYKLVGYTQWMTNWGEKSFFSSDLVIINPYTNDQDALQTQSAKDSLGGDSVQNSRTYSENRADDPEKNARAKLKIIPNKNTFSKREKVKLIIESIDREDLKGNYSISVRRRYAFNSLSPIKATDFTKSIFSFQNPDFDEANSIIPPELRGNLFQGKISTSNNKVSLENRKVFFSIPGNGYVLKLLTTDKNGNFTFSIDEGFGDNGFLQVLDEQPNDFKIEFREDYTVDYKLFEFKKFHLQPETKEILRKRSVYNQIENAYFSAKPDTIKLSDEKAPFYGKPEIVYNLDDFTRFKTVEETIIEIIDDVRLVKNRNNKTILSVRGYQGSTSASGYRSLVIVDGNAIQDIESLLSFDARKIKSVKLLRKKYVLGSQIFQGIIDIATFENDFYEFADFPMMEELALSEPVASKQYFKQVYHENGDNHFINIPDYRQQLLWEPDLRLNSDGGKIDFFSSDVTGDFEITLEGFTLKGEAISAKGHFIVN